MHNLTGFTIILHLNLIIEAILSLSPFLQSHSSIHVNVSLCLDLADTTLLVYIVTTTERVYPVLHPVTSSLHYHHSPPLSTIAICHLHLSVVFLSFCLLPSLAFQLHDSNSWA